MTSPVHFDYKKEDIFILGKDPEYGLDDTAFIAEKEYSIKCSGKQKKFCLSLH